MSWAKDSEIKFACNQAWTQRITESRRPSAEGNRRTSTWRTVADGTLVGLSTMETSEEAIVVSFIGVG